MAYTYIDGVARLGSSYTGLAGSIGYRLINADGTTAVAFTTTNVVETTIAGTYRVVTAGVEGLPVPTGFGGRVIWGPSGTDLVEEWIWPGKYENLAAMVAANVFTTASLANAPSGGGGSFPGTAPANWITSAAFAAGATLPRVTLVDTLTTYTGNTPQTGDSFARIGSGGVNLTSLNPAAVDALLTSNHGSGSWVGGNLTLNTGTVSASPAPSTTSITLTSGNMGVVSGQYSGRRFYCDVLQAGGSLETQPCVHTYANGVHTLTFATPNNVVPQAGDVLKAIG